MIAAGPDVGAAAVVHHCIQGFDLVIQRIFPAPLNRAHQCDALIGMVAPQPLVARPAVLFGHGAGG